MINSDTQVLKTSSRGVRRVVVATDLSESAQPVLERAARIAVDSGASLHLIHVCPRTGWGNIPGIQAAPKAEGVDTALATQQRVLQGWVTTLRQRDGIDAHAHVAQGRVVSEIAALVDRLEADLLVLGERHDGLLRELLLGTHAEQLLGRIKCSLLLVRQPTQADYRQVLLAVAHAGMSEQAWGRAQCVAGCTAHWQLLHVIAVPYIAWRQPQMKGLTASALRSAVVAQVEHQLAVWRDQWGLPQTTLLQVREGEASEQLLAFAAAGEVDLIILPKQPASRLADAVRGSVVRQVLGQSPQDILIAM